MSTRSLQSSRQKAARFALYGSLGMLLVLVLVLGNLAERSLRHEARWGEQDWSAMREVELLRDYIRIDTTRGKEIEGAEFLAAQLAAAGVEATIERFGDGRANLWAILEGESPEALVLHHHIDVWSVDDADQWLRPPFAAELDGPWLYGRGAFDMKSYGIAQLLAFLDAARLERRRQRSLILLATSDEEAGSDLGTRWILSQHPELAGRFWGVLTEGGVVEALSPDDIKYWGVENAQTQLLPVRFCSPSRQRLESLVADLEEWPANEIPLRLTPEFEDFARDYAPSRSRQLTRTNMSIPEAMLRNRRGFRRLPRFVQRLLRHEVAAWDIRQEPSGFTVKINLLLLPGVDHDEAVAELLPGWLTHGISMTVGEPEGASHGSPRDHLLFLMAVESLQRTYPGTAAGGYFLPGTMTDARFFRAEGIPAYGYSPFLFFSTDTMRADRINERIPLPGFVSGVRIYSELVRSVIAGPDH